MEISATLAIAPRVTVYPEVIPECPKSLVFGNFCFELSDQAACEN